MHLCGDVKNGNLLGLIVSREELKQIYRLMANEIEGAVLAEGTTYEMYCELRKVFGTAEVLDNGKEKTKQA